MIYFDVRCRLAVGLMVNPAHDMNAEKEDKQGSLENRQRFSPVCYVQSPELRKEFQEEKEGRAPDKHPSDSTETT